jgi:hypothetical protein
MTPIELPDRPYPTKEGIVRMTIPPHDSRAARMPDREFQPQPSDRHPAVCKEMNRLDPPDKKGPND